MKRQYISPKVIVMKTELENSILLASKLEDSLDNNGVDAPQIKSKKHVLGDLWDESWEDEEDDE